MKSKQLIIPEESTTKVTEEVSDKFCSNKEYGEPFIVNESDNTITYDIECWDTGNKWTDEEVFNHIEQMFQVFKIKPQDQLDVFEIYFKHYMNRFR